MIIIMITHHVLLFGTRRGPQHAAARDRHTIAADQDLMRILQLEPLLSEY
jgi:hypothetical protein